MEIGEISKKRWRNEMIDESEIIVLSERGEEKRISLRSREELKEETQEEETLPVGEFRAILSQVLAVTSINLILLDLGLVLAFPTIVIPDLLQSTESLSFTEEQASWFGSVLFIFQPLGSMLSGLLFEPVGRKKTMLFVNIPLSIGWLLLWLGTETKYLYFAQMVLGISIGFLDAPHITYLGEITQPKWRAILTSYAELCVSLGFIFIYFLGSLTSWRTVSAVCTFAPLLSILAISQIPESPVWLLSQRRMEDAMRSLCWLRGWVNAISVQAEFSNLKNHIEANTRERKLCEASENEELNTYERKKSVSSKLIKLVGFSDVCRSSVLKPLFLVVFYFGFSHIAGVTSTRPFIVDILNQFGSPMDPVHVTAVSSVVGLLGFISGMILVPKSGKRMLSIVSMAGCSLINGLISIYGFFFTHLNLKWIPICLIILLNYVWCLGIGQIPWMLISEVFPFRGRGTASGIAAAISYVQAFLFTKTYYSLQNTLTLPGVFAFYGSFTVFGSLFLYKYLPETEGKTLEQIESLMKTLKVGFYENSIKNTASDKDEKRSSSSHI